MKIKPTRNFRNPCYPINQMDTEKVYDAIHATNQPDWKEKGKIFAGEHLLERGDYIVVSS